MRHLPSLPFSLLRIKKEAFDYFSSVSSSSIQHYLRKKINKTGRSHLERISKASKRMWNVDKVQPTPHSTTPHSKLIVCFPCSNSSPHEVSAPRERGNRKRGDYNLYPYFAVSPSSSSMRMSWLYLAMRSVRESEPVFICPELVATAISAMVVSSVSPER